MRSAPRRRARAQQLRQDDRAELLERLDVAEEEGFVGGHRLDDVAHQRRVVALAQRRHQARHRRMAVLLRHRRELAFEEVGFLLGDGEARPLLEDARQKREIVAVHAAPRDATDATSGPISSSGRIAAQSPAAATAPGIPHTTLVA